MNCQPAIPPPAQLPTSPRPKRKTAKAAAETISKALDNTDESGSEEEYIPSGISSSTTGAPPSPKSRPPQTKSAKRSRSNASPCPNSGKKCALSPETTEYLKNWMLSPDHIDHPYPTEEEKARIMRDCGIEMKQLTNWFVNNRKRIWKPKLEELKKRQNENGVVVDIEEGDDSKRKKLCVKTAKGHSGVKAANNVKKLKVKVPGSAATSLANSALVNGRSSTVSPSQMEDASVHSGAMPPLPPPQVAAATITPLVDPAIITSFSNEEVAAAPLLPLPGMSSDQGASAGLGVMPHSCNFVDPLTHKMNRYVQPCALCSACRDWNAGEFCPWDLTGIIGDLSDDTSLGTEGDDILTDMATPKEEYSGSIVSEESAAALADSGNNTTLDAMTVEALSSGDDIKAIGISSFPSTASFPVPQEIGQGDLISDMVDMDAAWD